MAGYAAAKAHLFADGKAAQAHALSALTMRRRCELAGNLAQDDLPLTTIGAQNADLIYLANAFQSAGKNVSLADCPALLGAHNAQNAAAAFAVGQAMGLSQKQILAAFESFGGMPHRLQIIADYEAIKFVNDSKATNVEATRHALAAFDNIYWIAGGRAKTDADGQIGLDMLNPYFGNVRGAYLIGEAAQVFAAALADAMPTTVSARLTKRSLMPPCKPSPIIWTRRLFFLSPACASFDQYEDFEARGDAFITAAADWINADKAVSINVGRAR